MRGWVAGGVRERSCWASPAPGADGSAGASTSPLEAAARNGQEDETPTCEELVQRTFDRRRSLCARGRRRQAAGKRVPGLRFALA